MFAHVCSKFRMPFSAIIYGGALWLIGLSVHAAPQLVTPQLPPGTINQTYAASLLIGSSIALSSAGVTGLPAGLTATPNGSGYCERRDARDHEPQPTFRSDLVFKDGWRRSLRGGWTSRVSGRTWSLSNWGRIN